MSRYGIAGACYQDNNGKPLSGGKLYFYEPGTEDDKATYSNSAQTVANTQPVVLDAAGRQPDIFFTGEAKVIITTSAGVQIKEADPVGESSTVAAFVEWLVTIEYGIGDTVTDPDGNYFVSLVSANLGNEPAVSPVEWMELKYINVYNPNFSYASGDVCLYGNSLYLSRIGTNAGNAPSTSYAEWLPLTGIAVQSTVNTSAFSPIANTGAYPCDTSGGAFLMTLPLAPTAGDSISFFDYAGSFLTNNLTIGRNGENIMGDASNLICNMNNFSGTLYYIDTTRGWVLI